MLLSVGTRQKTRDEEEEDEEEDEVCHGCSRRDSYGAFEVVIYREREEEENTVDEATDQHSKSMVSDWRK